MIRKRFTSLLLAMAALLGSAAVSAQSTHGYALYGDVPTGYTNLTSNVTASAQGAVTKDADSPLTFTGKGLSGSQYCGTSNYLRLAFNAAQPMSLTSDFALHIFIKKAETATGDVQICLCKNGWNANRIPWLIANSAISSSEYSEIVLKYADRNTAISWNSFNDGNLIGTDVNFEANEMMRICAANGEQFMIDKIYLEATYTEPTPGPGPEPEPEPEFDAPVAVDGTGFLLYGATAPCGYDDLKSSVAYSAKGSLALNDAAGLKITGAGLPGRICETSNYLQMSFSAQQSLTLDENFSLHIVIAKSSSATGDVQISFCRNGWNNTRIAYTIANSAIGTEPTDIELKYTARNTGNWNSYGESAALGSPATFPAAEILRLCAAAGEEFTITGLYLQTSETPCSGDPSDETAPAGLTASASEVSQNSLKLTMTATDDSEGQITYVITYDTDKTKNVKAASGADAEVVIDGLTADTDYSFSIVAKDATGNTSTPVVVEQRTAREPLGYALYGAVPTDYADLTSKVTIAKAGSANWEAPTFTGAGNPGIIANTGNYLNVALSEAQMFTLTDHFALHIRLKKVSGTNDVQVSLTSGNWNACRAGWLIKNSKISDADYTEFVLEYANTDATLQYSAEQKQNLLGGKSFLGTILRICAANGEQFDIDQIYLEKTYTAPDPEPDPEQDPIGTRYYIVGGENPIDCNIAYNGGAYRDERITEYFSAKLGNSWSAIDFKPKETIENTINDDWYVVMRFRSCMDNGYAFGFNHTRLNLVNNGANYYMNSNEWAPYGNGTWQIVKYKLADANGSKPTQYLQANQIAVQLHVESGATLRPGDYIDIEYIYFTNDISTIDPGVQTGKKLMMGEDRDNSALLKATEGATFDVDFGRSFVADGYLYTLCLPFNMDAEKAAMYFPGTYSYLESSELRGELIHLNMEYSDHIEAGRPYLYLPSQDVPAYFFKDITIDAEETTLRSTTYFDMKGIYSPTVLEQGVDYFLGDDNYLYLANDNSPLKGFRAYFTIKENAPAGVPARVVFNHQTATDIDNVNDNDNANKILRDGNIYILRGEKVFTISGQLVK